MNITPMEMYWLTRMDNINGFFISATIIGGLGTFLLTGAMVAGYLDAQEGGKTPSGAFIPYLVLLWCVWAVCICGSVLVPTTKEMAAIHIIPAIVNNEKVQGMPDKVLGLAEEWLEELRPKAEAKK